MHNADRCTQNITQEMHRVKKDPRRFWKDSNKGFLEETGIASSVSEKLSITISKTVSIVEERAN